MADVQKDVQIDSNILTIKPESALQIAEQIKKSAQDIDSEIFQPMNAMMEKYVGNPEVFQGNAAQSILNTYNKLSSSYGRYIAAINLFSSVLTQDINDVIEADESAASYVQQS